MKKPKRETVSRAAAQKLYDLARVDAEAKCTSEMNTLHAQWAHDKANAVLAARDEALQIGRAQGRGNGAALLISVVRNRLIQAAERGDEEALIELARTLVACRRIAEQVEVVATAPTGNPG
jgi:hypothetical protein